MNQLPVPETSELVRRFRSQLGHKQWRELEETWLELLEAGTSLSELLGLCDLAERWAPKETAVTLLSVLAAHLKDKEQIEESLLILRRLAKLTPDDVALAREIANCIRLLEKENPLIERVLQKSGLGYGQPLLQSLELVDRYLALLPGRLLYDSERGPGKVKSLDLLLDRVTIAFSDSNEATFDTLTASKRLYTVARDGYFALLENDPDRLKQLAATEPGRVVSLFLRDIRSRATVAEIQKALARLIPAHEWDGFWERARKALAKEPHIQVFARPSRSYQWVEKPAEPGEVETPKSSARPRITFDPSKLANLTIPELQEAFAELATTTDRRHFLEAVKQHRPDWERVYAALFTIGRDQRCRTLIEAELSANRPELWRSALRDCLNGYRKSPEAFLWLLENAPKLKPASPIGLLSRSLELLADISHRPVWNRLRRLISEDSYRLVREALDELDQEEADRLLDRVASTRGLEPFRRDEIARLVTDRFPALAQTEEQIIYSTSAGIERAREELRQLTEKELPTASEELARARSHGDLSENYEFKAAKEKQARLIARINRLREELSQARAIDPLAVDSSKVSIGCRVSLSDPEGNSYEYLILGPWDADHERGIISYQSPLAQTLLGKAVGQTVAIEGKPMIIQKIEPGLSADGADSPALS